jgi:hypothetical protein
LGSGSIDTVGTVGMSCFVFIPEPKHKAMVFFLF